MEGRSSRLLEQIKKQNYRNYPIKNALLESETDYIKNNYFRHLALTLTQKGEASENQRYLFSRMIEGVEAEDKIEDYLRQAMDIEIDQYIEFMDQLKEKEIRYRFLLDAALIICCDIHTEEQEELLACFMETLKISLADAAFICETTRNVLKQDRDRYLGQMNANYGISFRDFAKEYFIDMAVEYYKISAERGDDVGQCNLANCYENGEGIEANRNKAIGWYRKSAAQGNEKVKTFLERLGESLY